MKGKAKCKALKEIRRQIAEENDIPYVVSQCTYQGDCKGTCPKCEAELKYLERELAVRQSLGKAVAVAGISVGLCAPLTACGPIDSLQEMISNIGQEQLAGAIEKIDTPIAGDIAVPETEEALIGETVPPETTVTLEGDIAIIEDDIEGGLMLEEDLVTE